MGSQPAARGGAHPAPQPSFCPRAGALLLLLRFVEALCRTDNHPCAVPPASFPARTPNASPTVPRGRRGGRSDAASRPKSPLPSGTAAASRPSRAEQGVGGTPTLHPRRCQLTDTLRAAPNPAGPRGHGAGPCLRLGARCPAAWCVPACGARLSGVRLSVPSWAVTPSPSPVPCLGGEGGLPARTPLQSRRQRGWELCTQ